MPGSDRARHFAKLAAIERPPQSGQRDSTGRREPQASDNGKRSRDPLNPIRLRGGTYHDEMSDFRGKPTSVPDSELTKSEPCRRKRHSKRQRGGGRVYLTLRGVGREPAPRTSVPEAALERPRDRVRCNFAATRPNQLWISDFRYVATWRGREEVERDARAVVWYKQSASDGTAGLRKPRDDSGPCASSPPSASEPAPGAPRYHQRPPCTPRHLAQIRR